MSPRRSRDLQPALDLGLPKTRPGRVERDVNVSVAAARRDDALGDLDAGLVALARAMARAVDVAESRQDVWAAAAASRELRAALERLRLDPLARGVSSVDPRAAFLAQLAAEPGTA